MYNLRSHKQNTIHLPVQIQLSDDNQFLQNILAQNCVDFDEQVNMSDSESEGSVSDLNCSDIVKDSDTEENTNVSVSQEGAGPSHKKHSNSTPHKSDPDVQSVINAQILEQLQKIGKRLDKIESKDIKKSADKSKIKNSQKKDGKSKKHSKGEQPSLKPSEHTGSNLHSLNEETLLQLKVEQRLQELSDLAKTGTTSKLKSQRGGSVEVLIKNRVKWPHKYVLSGVNKERVTYDQLNVMQWVAGFGRTMRDESDPVMKKHMLDYLISTMDDANDFSWTFAKASHAVVLCCMEQGEVKDYSDTLAIDRIRRANAHKHVPNIQNVGLGHVASSKKFSKTTKSMPCIYYNQGSCSQTKSHETRGVLYKHICASCFATTGRTFSHTEVECKNKNKQLPKNE